MISPHSFTESLRAFLSEALQGIFVHTPVTNGELVLPYVLLTCTAEAERIPGNHTWECNLAVELHTSGEDVRDLSSREMFSVICRTLQARKTRQQLDDSAADFQLYSISLRTIEEPQTLDNNFIQSATFRVVLQF